MKPVQQPSTSPTVAAIWWITTGALFGLGAVSILTIGPILLIAAVVLLVIGGIRSAWRSPWMTLLVSGFAAGPLFVAWLNRHGPGQVCQRTATATSCVDATNPWPLVVVGLILVSIGVILTWRQQRTARRWS